MLMKNLCSKRPIASAHCMCASSIGRTIKAVDCRKPSRFVLCRRSAIAGSTCSSSQPCLQPRPSVCCILLLLRGVSSARVACVSCCLPTYITAVVCYKLCQCLWFTSHFRARMDIQYACMITSRMDERVPLIRQAESRWEARMRVHPEVAAMGLPKAATTPGPEKDQLIPVPVSARTRSRPTHSSGLVQSELHMPVLQ